MSVHIGKKIKEELGHQEISVSDFAKRIRKSRNVIYNIFERKNMDTGLLLEISLELNTDFFSWYSAQKSLSSKEIKNFLFNQEENPYASQMIALTKQNLSQENEIAYLKKIISLLESSK
jgi:hypothetical protein